MDVQELRRIKVDLLDDIHELSLDPLGDAEGVRQKVEELFSKLENEFGKEDRQAI